MIGVVRFQIRDTGSIRVAGALCGIEEQPFCQIAESRGTRFGEQVNIAIHEFLQGAIFIPGSRRVAGPLANPFITRGCAGRGDLLVDLLQVIIERFEQSGIARRIGGSGNGAEVLIRMYAMTAQPVAGVDDFFIPGIFVKSGRGEVLIEEQRIVQVSKPPGEPEKGFEYVGEHQSMRQPADVG